jgi:hypothetical protein
MKDKRKDACVSGSVLVRSYRTRFRSDENPISEGGIWVNGRRDGIDWIDIIARNGIAYGEVTRMGVAERRIEQGNLASSTANGSVHVGDYDDPTALLSGSWGRNQHATATVFSRNQTEKYFQEVEIRLRSVMKPNWCAGYEVFWRCLTTGAAYAEIARWNGKVGDFTSLKKLIGPQFGVKDGDVVEAIVDGNVLKGFINGIEVISATDDAFDSGSPGIGFNFGVGNTNVDHGFTSFEVDTYDD